MNSNKKLRIAKNRKDDEFYTQYKDIEKEIIHYKEQLVGKIIYCNCDNPKNSNFYKYLKNNFHNLQLKKIICSYLSQESYVYQYDGIKETQIRLNSDGDFRCNECCKLLEESDIIITNPPFSLFREYIDLIMKYNKKFLVIGNKNAINYNNIFFYIKDNKMKIGYERPNEFDTPQGTTMKLNGLCRWFTNLDVKEKRNTLKLTKKFDKSFYYKLENFDVINVDKVKDIPFDYDGVIAVPITYIDYYDEKEYEIIGRSGIIDWAKSKECWFFTPPTKEKEMEYKKENKCFRIQIPYILDSNGKPKMLYYRLFIRKRKG